MKVLVMKKGELIKVIGQKDTFVILENVNGDIFNKIGHNREEKEAGQK